MQLRKTGVPSYRAGEILTSVVVGELRHHQFCGLFCKHVIQIWPLTLDDYQSSLGQQIVISCESKENAMSNSKFDVKVF